MSQWTHILGVIRYDYMAQVCWCSKTNGRPSCWNPKQKIKILKSLYKKDVPTGSERPIEVKVINSSRGPIVVLSGDLRDFGGDDVKQIVTWLNNISKEVDKDNKKAEDAEDTLDLRDSIVNCDVEYWSHRLIFSYKDKNWVIDKIPSGKRKEK